MKNTSIENKIYAAIIGYCEDREGKKVSNGHHMAQHITLLVSASFLSKQQQKILAILSTVPKTTKEIATSLKLSTKHVSSQLIQIQKKTQLVYSNTISKNKLKTWHL